MIITIDGPSGTGKSTIAKELARRVGYIFFDTGAMYRCVTYAIIKRKIDTNDLPALVEFLKTFQFKVKIRASERCYFVDDQDVSLSIRTAEVNAFVSQVSAIPVVRDKLVALQRQLAVGINSVFEGRDMGTVVFPEAEVKIFLTASAEVRAGRRYAELCRQFPDEAKKFSLEQVLKDITARDEYDSNREHSPLMAAKDACTVDTSHLTIDEVILKILEYKDSMKTRQLH